MAQGQFLVALIALALAITNVASQINPPSVNQPGDCNYPPCHQVPVSQTYYYPNWDNCDTYWTCENRQSKLSRCPPGQAFDLATYQCKTTRIYNSRVDFFVNPVFSCNVLLNGLRTSSLTG